MADQEKTKTKEDDAQKKVKSLFSKDNIKLLSIMIGVMLILALIALGVTSAITKSKSSFATIELNPETPYSFGKFLISIYETIDGNKELAGHLETEVVIKVADYKLKSFLQLNKAVLRSVIINEIEKKSLTELCDFNNNKRERKIKSLKRALTRIIAKNLPKGELFEIYLPKFFLQKLINQKKQLENNKEDLIENNEDFID